MTRLVSAEVEVTLKLDVVQRVHCESDQYDMFKQSIIENLAKVLCDIEDTTNPYGLTLAIRDKQAKVVFT